MPSDQKAVVLFIVSEGSEQKQIMEAIDANTVFFSEGEAMDFIREEQAGYDNPLEIVRYRRAD